MEIPADAETCPYCGYEIPRQKSSLKTAAILFALLLIWPLLKVLDWLLS
ncbi:MAG: zinc ribbon domain-containing protein [Bacteroidetes bacterium]|nr:MAG: zinc ribbon domain-containing protein [Bacteroidota bacterium]